MQTWNPMWEAPTDGSAILAVLQYEDGQFTDPITIRWHEPWREWVMSGCLIHIYNTGDPDDDARPVAWQPLPTFDAANDLQKPR